MAGGVRDSERLQEENLVLVAEVGLRWLKKHLVALARMVAPWAIRESGRIAKLEPVYLRYCIINS
jgi:hypothetical protein